MKTIIFHLLFHLGARDFCWRIQGFLPDTSWHLGGLDFGVTLKGYSCHVLEPDGKPSIFYLHPGRLTFCTWKMMVWKMIFLFNWVIFRFHVNLPGCNGHPFFSRDQTSSRIVGGHQQTPYKGHVNSPSHKGHWFFITRIGWWFQIITRKNGWTSPVPSVWNWWKFQGWVWSLEDNSRIPSNWLGRLVNWCYHTLARWTHNVSNVPPPEIWPY